MPTFRKRPPQQIRPPHRNRGDKGLCIAAI
jgi:hypothetical protein